MMTRKKGRQYARFRPAGRRKEFEIEAIDRALDALDIPPDPTSLRLKRSDEQDGPVTERNVQLDQAQPDGPVTSSHNAKIDQADKPG